jgi:hypothetical protein
MSTHGERIAALEATIPSLTAKVDEIHKDVKALLAAHNQQKGRASLLALIWTGLATLAGAIGERWISGHHS